MACKSRHEENVGSSKRALSTDVTLTMPSEPLFIGSWADIEVEIDPFSGLAPEDLIIQVGDGGPLAGIISRSKGEGWTNLTPNVRLLAGITPGGPYTVEVLDAQSEDLLASEEFEITDEWEDADGPSSWIGIGEPAQQPGPATLASPQNLDVFPVSGAKKAAVIFIEATDLTFDAQFSETEIGVFQEAWRDAVEDTIGDGQDVNYLSMASNDEASVRRYFQEVSYQGTGPNGLTITFDVFDEFVELPGEWSDYYSNGIRGAAYRQWVTAADDQTDVDWTQYDYAIFVTPELGCRPTGTGELNFNVEDPSTDTMVTKPLGWVCIGNVGNTLGEWEPTDSRQYYSLTPHELGHAMKLYDLYRDTRGDESYNSPRELGHWAMMHSDQLAPYMTAGHRLVTGWVRGDWVESFDLATEPLPIDEEVESFDLATEPLPIDEEVELVPIETAAGNGKKNVLEIIVAEGWSYYFEYRRSQSEQMGDRFLPTDDVVLGTDMISYGDLTDRLTETYGERAYILKLPDDGGDGPILQNEDDAYEETASEHPTYPTGLKVTLVEKDTPDSVTLRVEFDANERPDPTITTWPSATHRYQSPDIEVRNTRSDEDSAWLNVPHPARPNRVVAKVTNRGGLDAPDVIVDFSYINFSLGGSSTEVSLGSDTEDIDAGEQDVEFEVEWIVPATPGHYCVRARIRPYTAPGSVTELTDSNNFAQSNYDLTMSGSGSPARRKAHTVTVENPMDDEAVVNITLSQSNPLYRSYIDKSSLLLGSTESDTIAIHTEYAGEDYIDHGGDSQTFENYRYVPNQLLVQSFIANDDYDPGELGGVEIQVVEGLATKFSAFSAEEEGQSISVSGEVEVESTGNPVPGGKVILAIRKGSKMNEVVLSVSSGAFSTMLTPGFDQVWAYYLPPSGYADANSDVVNHP